MTGSLSTIVNVAGEPPAPYVLPPVTVTTTVSSPSASESSTGMTVIVAVEEPLGIVTEPGKRRVIRV